MDQYLSVSKYIDFNHSEVAQKAAELKCDTSSENELIVACFEFVRDQINHSWDFKQNPVTCKASDVLTQGTGYCYAKSHLLAALLRANRIPTGLCYQRLSVNDSGAPYCLHGLNAVFLVDQGWYRVDARGNKLGVFSDFCPPEEVLAYSIKGKQERDLPEIWAEPLPIVVSVLESYDNVALVHENLPDIQLLG